MGRVKFAISSHVSYHRETYGPLVTSMLRSGVPAHDIYVFVGGHDGTTYETYDTNSYGVGDSSGVHAYLVPHNSIDFTGVVSVLELGLVADRWFVLHDTVIVGPTFYERVTTHGSHGSSDANSSDANSSDAIPLTSDGPSMNMGSYAWTFLVSHRDEILSPTFKNASNDPDVVRMYKRNGVPLEDDLFRRAGAGTGARGGGGAYNHTPRLVTGPTDVYGPGKSQRIVEYYPDVDLYKMKANWRVADEYVTTL